MIFGYARVSTQEQNLDRQLDILKNKGAEEIIQEKVSGIKYNRPELIKLLDKLRKGDIILITDLTRLSRSTKDLFSLVKQIEKKGANIKSLKESWLESDYPTHFLYNFILKNKPERFLEIFFAKLIF